MKISHNWLKELLPHDLPTSKIETYLTEIGLEVEGITLEESIKGGLKGVVTGEVLTCAKHPNADKLSVTTVNIGSGDTLHIVCGAPNVAAGQKVLVATIGTVLYTESGESWKIKEAKVRGELSQGMICSEDELGLGTSHDGIMVLPADTVPGKPAAEYFNITSDEIIEIGLTPNRADANSHYGVARDLWAALHIHEGYKQALALPEILEDVLQGDSTFQVRIENTEACPHYTGIVIRGIRVGDSPEWLRNRLLSIGQRPLNNIIDITNYVMFELGQPLHAFDADKISGQEIVVKNLPAETPFITLDGNTVKLHQDDLIICDGNSRPMCIAGVYGGKDSGVTAETVNLFLESAYFDPASVRRTSFRHNLRTESASHYEKGTDPNQCLDSLLRAAYLITQIAGGQADSSAIDVYPQPIPPANVVVRPERIRTLIGKDISDKEIIAILEALEMEVKLLDSHWEVRVSSHKTDVTREADIIEEVVRIYGLNRIEPAARINYAIGEDGYRHEQDSRNIAMQYLSDTGYSEAMGLSIINGKNWQKISGFDPANGVRINNTSNTHLDLLRPDPLATVLEIVQHNQSHQQPDLRMFELGKIYYKEPDKGYIEETYLSIFATGRMWPESWKAPSTNAVDGLDLKDSVLNLLYRLQVTGIREVAGKDDPRFANALEIHARGKRIAILGNVATGLLKNAGIKGAMQFAHIYWDHLTASIRTNPPTFKEYSRFPVVRRDLALVLDKTIPYEEVRILGQKAAGEVLSKMVLFDVYTNEEQLGKEKHSISLGFYFTNRTKTFDETEIEAIMNKLIQTFETKLNGVIRK